LAKEVKPPFITISKLNKLATKKRRSYDCGFAQS
jgi:hypothetical protein